MLQNLEIPLVLAREFIEVQKEIKPLNTRLDKLKVALREFGPNTYEIEGLGTVTVSKPGEPRKTGQELLADKTKLNEVPPNVLSYLFECGFLRWEDKWSRATASKVEAKLLV